MIGYSELAREKMWARIHLIPVLQAEEDRDLVRRYYADKAREKQLLGKEIKVYHSDRWVSFHPYITNLLDFFLGESGRSLCDRSILFYI